MHVCVCIYLMQRMPWLFGALNLASQVAFLTLSGRYNALRIERQLHKCCVNRVPHLVPHLLTFMFY